MIRFFVALSDISGGLIRLSAEDSTHIRSLRLRSDELFVACDGEGTDYICRLGKRGATHYGSQIASRRSQAEIGCSIAEIVETRLSLGEPSIDCNVFIAFSKGDRLDYTVQKSVELGAHDIVLFPSERCVSFPDDVLKKISRLQRIALETAKQCGRGRVPVVSSVGSFEAAIRQAAPNNSQFTIHNSQLENGGHLENGVDNSQFSIPDSRLSDNGCLVSASGLSLFFYELEENLHLKQVLERHGMFDKVSIVTGPEGGFENREAEIARSAGLITVSLGQRILRCETAPVAALAAVMFYTGNL